MAAPKTYGRKIEANSESKDGKLLSVDVVELLPVFKSTSYTICVFNCLDRLGIVTRSKTGSLQPRTFNLEDLRSRNFALLNKKGDGEGKDGDSLLVINKDGEISRITRNKVSVVPSGPFLYKLACDGLYKNFVSQYSTNTLALNKPQHAEERDKKRHLSHKFSLTTASEFKWNGSVTGLLTVLLCTLGTLFLYNYAVFSYECFRLCTSREQSTDCQYLKANHHPVGKCSSRTSSSFELESSPV